MIASQLNNRSTASGCATSGCLGRWRCAGFKGLVGLGLRVTRQHNSGAWGTVSLTVTWPISQQTTSGNVLKSTFWLLPACDVMPLVQGQPLGALALLWAAPRLAPTSSGSCWAPSSARTAATASGKYTGTHCPGACPHPVLPQNRGARRHHAPTSACLQPLHIACSHLQRKAQAWGCSPLTLEL